MWLLLILTSFCLRDSEFQWNPLNVGWIMITYVCKEIGFIEHWSALSRLPFDLQDNPVSTRCRSLVFLRRELRPRERRWAAPLPGPERRRGGYQYMLIVNSVLPAVLRKDPEAQTGVTIGPVLFTLGSANNWGCVRIRNCACLSLNLVLISATPPTFCRS